MYKKTTILFGSLVVFFVIFSSCSKSNHPPSKPTNPYPADGAENITNTGLTLAWDADDPDNDILHYKIYMGKSAPFPLLGETDNESYTIRDSLDRGTTYYWKVVVFDEKGDSAIGDIWSFTTQENHPPNSPTNPSPTNGATGISIQNITLSWSCSDPDGDNLNYDLYFGESSNPPLLTTNLPDTTYTLSNLKYATKYYWKILARDEDGAVTTGPVWNFVTAVAYFDTFLPASGTYDTIIGNYYDPDPSYGYPWIALSSYGTSGADAYWTFYGLNDSLVDTLIIWIYSFDNGNHSDGEHYYVYDFDNAEWIHWGSSDKSEKWRGYYTINCSRYIDNNGMVRLKLVSGYLDHSHIKYVGIEENQNSPTKHKSLSRKIQFKPLPAEEIPETGIEAY